MLIAVAGRSNGLGPVLSGNTPLPVINCPPVKPENVAHDIWSSLNVPSGKLQELNHQSSLLWVILVTFNNYVNRSRLHDCSVSGGCSSRGSSNSRPPRSSRLVTSQGQTADELHHLEKSWHQATPGLVVILQILFLINIFLYSFYYD